MVEIDPCKGDAGETAFDLLPDFADFNDKQSIVGEVFARATQNALDADTPIVAGSERNSRLVKVLGRQCIQHAVWDIWRIADDDIERFFARGKEIGAPERDPSAYTELLAVQGSHIERVLTEIGRNDLCCGEFQSQAQRNAPAASPDVQDSAYRFTAEPGLKSVPYDFGNGGPRE